jgi:hypothetical protein
MVRMYRHGRAKHSPCWQLISLNPVKTNLVESWPFWSVWCCFNRHNMVYFSDK